MTDFFWAKTAQTDTPQQQGIPHYDRSEENGKGEDRLHKLPRLLGKNRADAAVRMLKTDEIRPNPSQPRRTFAPDAIASLADSIRRYGIIQPLTVRRMPDADSTYELIAGERRLRAAISIGMTCVPCVILEADGEASAAMAIIENIQRENLNMFEQAAAFSSLIRLYSLTQDEIAARLSVSQSFVANKLRLLRYLPEEREEILSAHLTERHARALLRLSGEDRRLALRHVIDAHLNVAETEAHVDAVLHPAEAEETAADKPPAKPMIPKNRPAILRDVRLFCNSLNHAIDIMRQAGIDATTSKRETEEGTEIRVYIPRTPSARFT